MLMYLIIFMFFCFAIYSLYDRLSNDKKPNFNEREALEIDYWYNTFESYELKYDKDMLFSALSTLESAFGIPYGKLRFDDKLQLFDWNVSFYSFLIGDSMLDSAIEELTAEKKLPKNTNKDIFDTVGSLLEAVMQFSHVAPVNRERE